jgi:hypothetical protein
MQNPTVELFNTGFITITVEQIIDGAASINIANTTISRSGTGSPQTVELKVEAPAGTYSSIQWSIKGAGIYANNTYTSDEATFTVDANKIEYNSLGGHTVYLVVVKGGVTYNKTITVTIVE